VLAAALWVAGVGTGAPAASATATLVDAKNHDEVVTGAAAPGSVVDVKVTATLSTGERWYSTNYAIGSGSTTCLNTGNHTGGTPTEYLDNVTLPEQTPSPARVMVRLYSTNDCSGSSIASDNADFTIATLTANPTLVPRCDMRVALVLDASGSIGTTQGATKAVRDGATAFVDGLVDSGAQLAVLDFSTTARTRQLGTPPQTYNTVTQSFASGPFASYINNTYNPSGYTNWQDALQSLNSLNPKPEFVVFVTDGDPTARNTATGAETGFPDGSYSVMNPAFLAANQLKGAGAHMFAMGVGAALTNAGSQIRLRGISGPVQFPQHPLITSDYTVISDFQQLQEALATIGRALCSLHVDVTKLVDQTGDGTFGPENAWDFRGTVTVSGQASDSYRWFAPGVVTGPPSGGNTRTGTTANDFAGNVGRTTFAWKPSPTTISSQIVLTDVGKPGYHFGSVACTKNGDSLSVAQAPTITIGSLALNDAVACTFRDQVDRGQLRVAKHFVGHTTAVSLLIDGVTKKTSSDQDFATDFVGVSADNHQVSEEFVDPLTGPLYDSSYVCADQNGTTITSGNGVVVAGGVDVHDGQRVTCTFTNKKRGISVWVGKAADPTAIDEPGGQVRFDVTVLNTADAPVTLTSLHDDVYGDLDSGSPDSDHTWISSDCATGVPLEASDGTLGGEDTYTCSFVGDVTGGGGTSHKDTVTGTITDASGETASESDTATVDVTDVQPGISVTKSASPRILQNGGTVSFTAIVTNTSTADALNIDRLTDSIYGDLIDGPVKASCTDGSGSAVSLPHTLPMGESLICTFQANVTATQTDTITASGTDGEGNRVEDAALAGVLVIVVPPPEPPQPPPPPPPPPSPPEPSPEPPAPVLALSVAKSAPASVYLTALGTATFEYDIRITATGPATNSSLVDQAPRGSRFVAIVHKPNPGSCAIANAGRALLCHFGDLVNGQSVAVGVRIALIAHAGTTIVNTVTAACKPAVPAPCQAKASAKTKLLAPFLPPAKCTTVSVSPQTLTADGTRQPVTVRLRVGKKPAAGVTVVLVGPGIRRSGNTGSTGVFRTTVSPQTPGILVVGLRGAKACSAGRVGLVAPATPPLTG
jgi:uncharacterized repeat protein (TIGR01451 family)